MLLQQRAVIFFDTSVNTLTWLWSPCKLFARYLAKPCPTILLLPKQVYRKFLFIRPSPSPEHRGLWARPIYQAAHSRVSRIFYTITPSPRIAARSPSSSLPLIYLAGYNKANCFTLFPSSSVLINEIFIHVISCTFDEVDQRKSKTQSRKYIG